MGVKEGTEAPAVQKEEVVKQEAASATKAEDVKAESSTEEDFELLVGEKDRQIPYKVFKERNDKLRQTERELKEMQAKFEDKLAQEREAIKSKYESEYSTKLYGQDSYSQYETPKEDPKVSKLEQQIESLRNTIRDLDEGVKHRDLKSQMKELKSLYPHMAEEHVLSLASARKDLSLDQCAEHSHNYFVKNADKVYKQMLEEKKRAAEKKVVTKEQPLSLKPEEKPKDLKSARAKMEEYFNSLRT